MSAHSTGTTGTSPTPRGKRILDWISHNGGGAFIAVALVSISVILLVRWINNTVPPPPVITPNASVAMQTTGQVTNHSTAVQTSSEQFYSCGMAHNGIWGVVPAIVTRNGDNWTSVHMAPMPGWPNGRKVVREWNSTTKKGTVRWGDQSSATWLITEAVQIPTGWKFEQEDVQSKTTCIGFVTTDPDQEKLEKLYTASTHQVEYTLKR